LTRSSRVKWAWINDFDVGIASIWSSVMKDPNALLHMIKGFTPTVDAFYEFKEYLLEHDTDDQSVELAFKKIAIHQMSFSGLGSKSGGPLGGKTQKSDYGIDCRWSVENLEKLIHSYHKLFSTRSMKHGKCDNFDFKKLITTKGKAFLYVDPPYYEKGPQLYQHFFTDRDHFRLAHALEETDQPWLLSYDNCVAIKKIYKWAEILEIPVNYTINTSRARTELLITSKEYKSLLNDPNATVDLLS